MNDYIATGRICALGKMTETHLQAHVGFLQNPEVTRYLRIRRSTTIEDQRTWFQRTMSSPSDEILAIFSTTAEPHQFIGLAHLREIDEVDRIAHGGMLIGDARFWGSGIGTEARLLQLKHAFDDLGLRWVYGRTVSPNIRAQRPLTGTGYQKQGLRPSCRLVEGVYEDEILYGACRETWEPVWNSYRS